MGFQKKLSSITSFSTQEKTKIGQILDLEKKYFKKFLRNYSKALKYIGLFLCYTKYRKSLVDNKVFRERNRFGLISPR